MAFPRWVFRIAGIYGLVVLVPQYFLEGQIGRDDPPAITHPEFFYGFLGVGVAWQVAFLIIGQDPVRYRLLMIPAILEKASFAIAVAVLLALSRVSGMMLAAGGIDLLLGVLFAVCLVKTHRAPSADARGQG